MFLVKTTLQLSTIHGLGAFADEFIPAGTKTWELDSRFDSIFTKNVVDTLPPPVREEVAFHAYLDPGGFYILCNDNAKFMNHSSNPNINSHGTYDIASRDIEPGEELTCDYSVFDVEFDAKLYK